MVKGNLEIKTFEADSKERLDELIDDFHNEHPGAKVQITNYRVGYNEGHETTHDYAIFYLD